MMTYAGPRSGAAFKPKQTQSLTHMSNQYGNGYPSMNPGKPSGGGRHNGPRK